MIRGTPFLTQEQIDYTRLVATQIQSNQNGQKSLQGRFKFQSFSLWSEQSGVLRLRVKFDFMEDGHLFTKRCRTLQKYLI